LLRSLQDKLRENDSFEVRREIVKTLVKEVIVHTLPPIRGYKNPRASFEVHFTFFKGVNRTVGPAKSLIQFPSTLPMIFP
jgi:site-specific DNA recombinase